ncbi:uncharacterized protein METZ01_LOCUS473957 [marine metagenome]|uniref:Uncharacterized protein n=1 Tax=marine metagenome TaxID=408172 RepID=A0A383BMS2_9ZZZZ
MRQGFRSGDPRSQGQLDMAPYFGSYGKTALYRYAAAPKKGCLVV